MISTRDNFYEGLDKHGWLITRFDSESSEKERLATEDFHQNRAPLNNKNVIIWTLLLALCRIPRGRSSFRNGGQTQREGPSSDQELSLRRNMAGWGNPQRDLVCPGRRKLLLLIKGQKRQRDLILN